MTRPALVLPVVVAAALATATPAHAQSHKGKISHWDTPEEGFLRAQNLRRPILLFFTASW